MIELKRVEVVFNPGTALENHVLRDLNLRIPKGQFVTVIGSNGAGKSTMLNLLSGEVSCQSGRVSIDQSDITTIPVHQRATYIARVFQDPLKGTCETLTIEENLALAWRRDTTRGLRFATKRTLKAEFISQLKALGLGLENRLDDKVGLLSGGQRQALSLVMASLRPMKLLLLDEHTAALDPKTAQFILDLTEDIVKRNELTTLMVTHSMKQALSIGNRTIMMHQGKIAFDIAGSERKQTSQEDLLRQFSAHDETLVSDSMLLS